MNLYDKPIQDVLRLTSEFSIRELPLSSSLKESGEKVFLFPEDAGTDLGDASHPSGYFYGYSSDPDFLGSDSIALIGKDLYELPATSPFAHIYLFEIDEQGEEKDQEFYRIFRNIEYRRYKVNPEGFMLRVNTNQLREGARVAKDLIRRKISFSDIGMSFLAQFHKEKRVKALRQFFITDPTFPYEKLLCYSKESEAITIALDHIMKKLKMDCKTCQFKDICDEIEGMRKLHNEVKNDS